MNAQNSFPTGVINLRMSNLYLGLPGGSVVKILPAIQEPKEVRFQSLGQEDSPGGGHSSPLQYPCLENPMDGGASWATIRRVAKSRTPLK